MRKTAIFWLGRSPGKLSLLADLARDKDESFRIRKAAVFAIGMGREPAVLEVLQSLYKAVADPQLKKQIIFSASMNESEDEAVNFLIGVARQDPDRQLRKQAIFWLGQKAGRRNLELLNETANSGDVDTELQKHAVFAISRRPKDEAVPLLIKIAKTHSKASVRKQAIFWLARVGDERALQLFEELLAK